MFSLRVGGPPVGRVDFVMPVVAVGRRKDGEESQPSGGVRQSSQFATTQAAQRNGTDGMHFIHQLGVPFFPVGVIPVSAIPLPYPVFSGGGVGVPPQLYTTHYLHGSNVSANAQLTLLSSNQRCLVMWLRAILQKTQPTPLEIDIISTIDAILNANGMTLSSSGLEAIAFSNQLFIANSRSVPALTNRVEWPHGPAAATATHNGHGAISPLQAKVIETLNQATMDDHAQDQKVFNVLTEMKNNDLRFPAFDVDFAPYQSMVIQSFQRILRTTTDTHTLKAVLELASFHGIPLAVVKIVLTEQITKIDTKLDYVILLIETLDELEFTDYHRSMEKIFIDPAKLSRKLSSFILSSNLPMPDLVKILTTANLHGKSGTRLTIDALTDMRGVLDGARYDVKLNLLKLLDKQLKMWAIVLGASSPNEPRSQKEAVTKLQDFVNSQTTKIMELQQNQLEEILGGAGAEMLTQADIDFVENLDPEFLPVLPEGKLGSASTTSTDKIILIIDSAILDKKFKLMENAIKIAKINNLPSCVENAILFLNRQLASKVLDLGDIAQVLEVARKCEIKLADTAICASLQRFTLPIHSINYVDQLNQLRSLVAKFGISGVEIPSIVEGLSRSNAPATTTL